VLSACGQKEETQPDSEASEVEEVVPVITDEEVEEELVEEPEIELPKYELNSNWGLQPIEEADSKVVLLTIDDAPDKHALEMAKTLKELDVPAIFFVNGHFIKSDEKKEILKEIHKMGFQIGNHTATHANLQSLTEENQREEIVSVSNEVEEVIGERPEFFRAPFGQNTDFSRALVKEEGMLLMNWSYGYDWEKDYMDAESLTDIMVNTELLHDGSNLLMHDREWTAAALKGIVEGLREKGYGFIDPETIQGIE